MASLCFCWDRPSNECTFIKENDMHKLLISITVSAAVAFAAGGFRRPSIPQQEAATPPKPSARILPIPLPGAGPGFAVVELFTSEGCSSCPPADKALAKIAREYPDNVYVLGFHVDYWDRLGWKDAYSSEDYTHRQQEYAQQFRLNSIYTPQAVVNGKKEFVGSDESRLRSAVEAALAVAPTGKISLSAQCDDGRHVKVSYTLDDPGKATLQVALVQSQAISQVLRGENQGRKLQHVNVVRAFQSASLKSSGNGGVVDLKLPDGLQVKDCKIIAFLQNKEDGRIIKAGQSAIL